MFRLDRTRDYAEVHDNGRMLFAQGGRVFTLSGDEVAGGSDSTQSEIAEISCTPLEPPPGPLLTASGDPAKVGADDMRLAANRALKSQMEAFQEPWQGVDHARKFLGLT
jgi:hypothetical protein